MSFFPSSYDPYSPTYDPSAASPCNPFPTSSPFATFSFTPPRTGIIFDMDKDSESESTPRPSPQPTPLDHTAALARFPPPHSAPALRRTKPCRFYLSAAGCKTGRWCNFKHPVGAGAGPDGDSTSGSLEALRAMVVRSRGDPNDASTWDSVPDVRDLDPDWGKKSDDEVHPKFRTQPCRNFLLGLCRYGAKCQFIHAPGLFAGAAEVPTSLPVSRAPVPVSVWGPHPGIGASPPESSPGEKLDQMSLYYRTKPCKFFNTEGTCPHGANCKFIHDPNRTSPTSALVSWANDDRELDFDKSPHFDGPRETGMDVDRAAMHDMTNGGNRSSSRRRGAPPQRETSAAREREREREAGLYKPLWRVVGGGVKIGKTTDARKRMEEVEDDDAVLEYQPFDASRNVAPEPPSVFSNTSPLAPAPQQPHPTSPLDFTYTPFDPAQYPPHALLRPPSPTDVPLDIVMGRLENYGATRLASGRKRRVVTGADLLRGLGGGGGEREKPRLTIAVPTPVAFARSPQQEVVTRTTSGEDLLDWHESEQHVADEGEEVKVGLPRRVRSTPPTPRSSASYLDVPVMPQLPAETP